MAIMEKIKKLIVINKHFILATLDHLYLLNYSSRFPSKHPDLDVVYGSWIIIVLVSAQGSGYKPAQFGLTLLQLPIMHYNNGENSEIYLFIALFFWSANHSL